ncbi:hypothetical protein BDZ88DRAFT_231132 [Geranomyces variabilis]|nr:hypothetical protein BDZ88DRAFT_231132 [Geranomyces variabilis]
MLEDRGGPRDVVVSSHLFLFLSVLTHFLALLLEHVKPLLSRLQLAPPRLQLSSSSLARVVFSASVARSSCECPCPLSSHTRTRETVNTHRCLPGTESLTMIEDSEDREEMQMYDPARVTCIFAQLRCLGFLPRRECLCGKPVARSNEREVGSAPKRVSGHEYATDPGRV